jgi:hypothetical protein
MKISETLHDESLICDKNILDRNLPPETFLWRSRPVEVASLEVVKIENCLQKSQTLPKFLL